MSIGGQCRGQRSKAIAARFGKLSVHGTSERHILWLRLVGGCDDMKRDNLYKIGRLWLPQHAVLQQFGAKRRAQIARAAQRARRRQLER
jgi:hypothetical protein